MIIYIVGYGRSGSTATAQLLEEKLNAVNLGEVKYLYRNDKDDLLDSFWINFKNRSELLARRSSELKKFDNVFGFLKWNQRKKYLEYWERLFDDIGVSPYENIIIDTSKTTLDVFMRGIYLYHSFDNVCFVQPHRNTFQIVKSLFKGKNSNLERGSEKDFGRRFFHTFLVGLPHLLITKLLTLFYRSYNFETIDLKNITEETNNFIHKYNLKEGKASKKIPMIYGNRSRKK